MVLSVRRSVAVYVTLGLASAPGACRREAQPAPGTASHPIPVQALVGNAKQYAERLKAEPTGNRPSPEQISKLTSLLDQLLCDMGARALASQQGSDVAKPEAQVAADVAQLQQVQHTLPSVAAEQATPSASGQEKNSILDKLSETLGKIIQIAQQGKELAGVVRPPQQSAPQESGSLQSSLAPSPQAPADTESSAQPSETAGGTAEGQCCHIIASPALTGRLGRLVVAFPGGANAGSSRVDVFRAGEQTSIQSSYGAQTWDLLPGTYAVTISGARVEGVTVQSGHDTRVRVGILRVNAGGSTRVDLLDAGGKAALVSSYGAQVIGLPVGTFRVQIAGQSEAVTIQEGKITEF
jgi:hypothetical protein